ncbi:hypothetical protein ASA1KI_44880 [Opitutales bacterium ASA1]|uniref:GYF domain-containing protein n=1 Tax=Congregicoccus parvus TaxID=3081749 RepID=UPI002B2C8D93|nr:hypothetical protein ASA1KI_44880 [Opitutales bacterium ASA1]
MQEYYIRKEGDEDSRGPFTVEQLVSLVEAGQVDRQTFYYDALAEKWVEIQSSAELVATLFPVKKKLTIRQKETVRTLNVTPGVEDKPITVEEMLAAAEGMTDETYARRDLSAERARYALWGMRIMALAFVFSAAAMLVPNMSVLSTLEFGAIASSPLILIGIADLLVALFLFLEVTHVYGLVRIRAVIGVGFFLVFFLSAKEYPPLGAVLVGSAAVYGLTLTSSLPAVITMGLLGLAGMGGFAYWMIV